MFSTHSRVCSRHMLHGRLRIGIQKNSPTEPTFFHVSLHAMLFSLAALWRWHCIVVLSFEKNVGQTMDHACSGLLMSPSLATEEMGSSGTDL